MAKRELLLLTVLVGLIGALIAFLKGTAEPERPPPVRGTNNTVLFAVNVESGLSNVHLATIFSLLEHHPEVTVHFASWSPMIPKVERVSTYARKKTPESRPVAFHELPPPSLFHASNQTTLGMVAPPGLGGLDIMLDYMPVFVSPWTAEHYLELYEGIRGLIRDIDPAVVVLDILHHPAIDATRDANRWHVILAPNPPADLFVGQQPWLAAFWKYPFMGSGHSFPVAWREIPSNIYQVARCAYVMATNRALTEKRVFLREHGVSNPIDFFAIHKPGAGAMITQDARGASVPVMRMPPNVTTTGPIAVSVASAEEQDPELVAWLARAPTVLVNLGSMLEYDEERAGAMAGALRIMLQRTGVQVLWKLHRRLDRELDDSAWRPLVEEFIEGDRLRVSKWLTVDPLALLETGHIVVSVHHGGASCYHEAVAAGVPHLILPAWADCYNIAVLAEASQIGVWGNKKAAPGFDVDELSRAFLQLVDGSPSGVLMRDNAKRVAEAIPRPGRDAAADEIARLAARGQ